MNNVSELFQATLSYDYNQRNEAEKFLNTKLYDIEFIINIMEYIKNILLNNNDANMYNNNNNNLSILVAATLFVKNSARVIDNKYRIKLSSKFIEILDLNIEISKQIIILLVSGLIYCVLRDYTDNRKRKDVNLILKDALVPALCEKLHHKNTIINERYILILHELNDNLLQSVIQGYEVSTSASVSLPVRIHRSSRLTMILTKLVPHISTISNNFMVIIMQSYQMLTSNQINNEQFYNEIKKSLNNLVLLSNCISILFRLCYLFLHRKPKYQAYYATLLTFGLQTMQYLCEIRLQISNYNDENFQYLCEQIDEILKNFAKSAYDAFRKGPTSFIPHIDNYFNFYMKVLESPFIILNNNNNDNNNNNIEMNAYQPYAELRLHAAQFINYIFINDSVHDEMNLSNRLFDTNLINVLLQLLITRYVPIRLESLNVWYNSPEDYLSYEITAQNSIRSMCQELLCQLVLKYPRIILPNVKNLMNHCVQAKQMTLSTSTSPTSSPIHRPRFGRRRSVSEGNSNPPLSILLSTPPTINNNQLQTELQQCIQENSIYSLVGIAYDVMESELPFEQWYQEILFGEMRQCITIIKTPNDNMVKRLKQRTLAKLFDSVSSRIPSQIMPHIFQFLYTLLRMYGNNNSDIVVAMSVIEALCSLWKTEKQRHTADRKGTDNPNPMFPCNETCILNNQNISLILPLLFDGFEKLKLVETRTLLLQHIQNVLFTITPDLTKLSSSITTNNNIIIHSDILPEWVEPCAMRLSNIWSLCEQQGHQILLPHLLTTIAILVSASGPSIMSNQTYMFVLQVLAQSLPNEQCESSTSISQKFLESSLTVWYEILNNTSTPHQMLMQLVPRLQIALSWIVSRQRDPNDPLAASELARVTPIAAAILEFYVLLAPNLMKEHWQHWQPSIKGLLDALFVQIDVAINLEQETGGRIYGDDQLNGPKPKVIVDCIESVLDTLTSFMLIVEDDSQFCTQFADCIQTLVIYLLGENSQQLSLSTNNDEKHYTTSRIHTIILTFLGRLCANNTRCNLFMEILSKSNSFDSVLKSLMNIWINTIMNDLKLTIDDNILLVRLKRRWTFLYASSLSFCTLLSYPQCYNAMCSLLPQILGICALTIHVSAKSDDKIPSSCVTIEGTSEHRRLKLQLQTSLFFITTNAAQIAVDNIRSSFNNMLSWSNNNVRQNIQQSLQSLQSMEKGKDFAASIQQLVHTLAI